MANNEVMLLGGPPGSGKSSIGKRFVELGNPKGARHLSIGDLKRDITAGKVQSAYAELFQQNQFSGRKSGAAPSEAMIGIMEEFIQSSPNTLTIIDGFPRYEDRIAPFKESVRRIGADVLALCIVEVDEEILMERLSARPSRSGQRIKDPAERLEDHNTHIAPTLETLARDYPTYTLDGTLPSADNAARILAIYQQHTSI